MLKLAVLIGLVAVVASGLIGGFEKVASLEDAQKLAQWSTGHPSVKGLLNFEDATVAQVVEAQRQLVNGLNYRIKFNVIGRNQADNKYAAKQCYLELYVSFADERQVKSVQCEDNMEFFGKQPYAGQEVEGGEESYQLQTDLAKWAVNEHKKLAVNQFNAPDADLMQVKKFTRQVVAGMKYRLTFSVLARRADNKYQSQDCYAEIWDRPWLNLRSLESITCQDTKEITPVTYDAVLGGEQAESDYQKAQDLAQWAAKEHIATTKSNQFSSERVTLLRVPKLTKQVVAGIIYRGQMVVLSELEDNKYQSKACDFEVWERVWMTPARELVSINCQNTKEVAPVDNYEVVLGGEQAESDYQKAQDLAQWAAKEHIATAKSNQFSSERVTLLRVPKLTKQVVAGIIYRGQMVVLSELEDNKYQSKACEFEVLERAWMTPARQLVSINCQNTNEVAPVDNYEVVLGGEQEENDYQKAQDLAQWAAKTHIATEKSNQFSSERVTLLRVPKLTKQVVAGIIYRGQMVVLSELEDNKYQSKACEFEVWERAWMTPARELVSMTCKDTNEVAPPSVYSVEGGFGQPGAFQKMENNQKSQELAQWVVELPEAKQALGETVERIIVLKVEPAEVQIVAGAIYRFKADVLIQSNEQPPKYTFQRCSVEVYERSWENLRAVTSHSCVEFQP